MNAHAGLRRRLSLAGLAATGICSMLGAAINVLPFMLQRSVPGIGPWVMPAYLFAAVPALLAAFSYAVLASAMPRAGGSYVFASRSLSPYLGFVASFSQWFGLSIAIGVVSYLIVPFLRDIASALELLSLASALESGGLRVGLALFLLWSFVVINLRGLWLYERILLPLMVLMFVLGGVVIVAGFHFDQTQFAAALWAREGQQVPTAEAPPFRLGTFLAASALLFSSFIGFDSIAQAGGEARNPRRSLPAAIAIAVLAVGSFYFLFTAAVYHAVPWSYIAQEAVNRDLTAPGLLGFLLPTAWTVAIVAGAAVALINDLPAMLLAVSRLMFAWGEDGVFPRATARIHHRWQTPHVAIVASGLMASAGILGSHLAGDFFLGVDILVTAMLVNYILVCLSVVALRRRNPALAERAAAIGGRGAQTVAAWLGAALLSLFLIVQLARDLSAPAAAWYFRSTWVYLLVMAGASGLYLREVRALRRAGVDLEALFATLPAEASSEETRP